MRRALFALPLMVGTLSGGTAVLASACRSGGVVGECNADGDCVAGQQSVCDNHLCVIPCSSDLDCPGQQKCEAKPGPHPMQCVKAGCHCDTDCPDGTVCQTYGFRYTCEPATECDASENCLPGETCGARHDAPTYDHCVVKSTCSCSCDSDCAPGQLCGAGECLSLLPTCKDDQDCQDAGAALCLTRRDSTCPGGGGRTNVGRCGCVCDDDCAPGLICVLAEDAGTGQGYCSGHQGLGDVVCDSDAECVHLLGAGAVCKPEAHATTCADSSRTRKQCQ